MANRPYLIGIYNAPSVRKDEVVSSLYRDRDCRVTSWTDALIQWPRIQPVGQCGGSGLWVNETLARAKQLKLLGTDDDEVIAKRTGPTREAVRCQRTIRKIPKLKNRRRK